MTCFLINAANFLNIFLLFLRLFPVRRIPIVTVGVDIIAAVVAPYESVSHQLCIAGRERDASRR